MEQVIVAENRVDADGNPAGGIVKGKGISIEWQSEPLGRGEKRKEPNGAFVEGVLKSALQRLYFYQEGKFKCRENAIAITKIEEALMWCQKRTSDREKREVEGTHII
jgi:hypothetical protein